MDTFFNEDCMKGKIYRGYYYKGVVFEGQSALPFMLGNDRSMWPFNWRLEPPWDKTCPIPGKRQGVIEYTLTDIGFAYDENSDKKHFFIVSPHFTFNRIR